MPERFASLCFLSYRRPQMIVEAIRSAVENAGMPTEVIVHDDGSDYAVREGLTRLLDEGMISHLMLNPPGHNEGVGKAVNRTFANARGDPVCKLDQDLTFSEGWLATVSTWLREDPAIGMFGLFRYEHDPVDWRKMNHRAPAVGLSGYDYCDDFVGSAMVVPRRILNEFGPFEEHSAAFAEDVAYKKGLRAADYELALPREDLAVNRGFGPGPSTVVYHRDGNPMDVAVTEIHDGPFVVDKPACAVCGVGEGKPHLAMPGSTYRDENGNLLSDELHYGRS